MTLEWLVPFHYMVPEGAARKNDMQVYQSEAVHGPETKNDCSPCLDKKSIQFFKKTATTFILFQRKCEKNA